MQINEPVVIENLMSYSIPRNTAIKIIKKAVYVAVMHYSK